MTMILNSHTISTALPFGLSDLRKHLKILDDTSDHKLIRVGLTAAAGVEQFAQIALVTQTIAVTVFDPTSAPGLPLPIEPMATEVVPTVLIDGRDIPYDLTQALLDQAALHYDGRSPMDAHAMTYSPQIARIGARYRGGRSCDGVSAGLHPDEQIAERDVPDQDRQTLSRIQRPQPRMETLSQAAAPNAALVC